MPHAVWPALLQLLACLPQGQGLDVPSTYFSQADILPTTAPLQGTTTSRSQWCVLVLGVGMQTILQPNMMAQFTAPIHTNLSMPIEMVQVAWSLHKMGAWQGGKQEVDKKFIYSRPSKVPFILRDHPHLARTLLY